MGSVDSVPSRFFAAKVPLDEAEGLLVIQEANSTASDQILGCDAFEDVQKSILTKNKIKPLKRVSTPRSASLDPKGITRKGQHGQTAILQLLERESKDKTPSTSQNCLAF